MLIGWKVRTAHYNVFVLMDLKILTTQLTFEHTHFSSSYLDLSNGAKKIGILNTKFLFLHYPIVITIILQKIEIHSYRLLFRQFCPLGNNNLSCSFCSAEVWAFSNSHLRFVVVHPLKPSYATLAGDLNNYEILHLRIPCLSSAWLMTKKIV